MSKIKYWSFVILFICMCLNNILFSYKTIKNLINNEISPNYKQLVEKVKESKNMDDTMIVYGNESYYYWATDSLPISKYTYQYPLISVNSAIENEFIKTMQDTPPDIIVFAKSRNPSKTLTAFMENFVRNEYVLFNFYEDCEVYYKIDKLELSK